MISDIQMLSSILAVLVVATIVLVIAVRWWRANRSAPSVDEPAVPIESEPGGPPASAPALDSNDEPVGSSRWVRGRLAQTRNRLAASLAEAFGAGVSDAAWEGLEEALIGADVGVTAATEIVDELRAAARDRGVTTEAGIRQLLAEQLTAMLAGPDRTLNLRNEGVSVWLVTGVNGTGKTTTIGKLAAQQVAAGRSVVLAAADTFRAAAAAQLGVWAQRTGADLVAKDEGADPASVAFEAYESAVRQGADLLIIDTAGRLHNKRELMDELGKVRRVVTKRAGEPDETLLVLDATTGQNGIAQAQAFLDAVEVTGIALTKLDGSSKGGIVLAVQRELGLPVKLVGLGEGINDLAVFDPALFVAGLLDVDAVPPTDD